MSPERPPNRAVPVKPKTPPFAPGPPSIVGGMTVVITIGEVSITIAGPVAKVFATCNWLFGSSTPSAVISRLQLVFGPEAARASMTTKK